MRKTLKGGSSLLLLTAFIFGCAKEQKQKETINNSELTLDEKALIKSAGFNGGWAEKTTDGSYLIEGDILLTWDQLQEMSGTTSTNIRVANEEQYRTLSIVKTPPIGQRTIGVQLGSGFPAHYSTGLDSALSRYNRYNLKLKFVRTSSWPDILISAADLGTTSAGDCILGQAAGFPSGGNPASGFTLSNSSCALSYMNTAARADEVIAHEIGHCIGFRHTDYMNRSSCGQNVMETGSAVHIPGTPETVTGTYNSWMMACVNDNPVFSASDSTALNYVY